MSVAKELTIYTDGACSPNPGPGGWGAVILSGGAVVAELSGNGGDSTNNRMELTAAVAALRSVEESHRIVLYTDSQYVKKGITEWIDKWQRNNWRTADRQEVKNSDLWRELLDQVGRHQLIWKRVRGHAMDRWNNRADELAVAARLGNGTRPARESSAKPVGADDIHLYTGVTCKHSSGVGAWSVIMGWRSYVKVIGGGTEGMTANQLYLHAVIEGLAGLKKLLPVHVHTHSGYLYEGATAWLEGWRKRDWQTREGAPVSNRELWQRLAGLMDRFQVEFHLEDKQSPLCAMQEAKELAREFEL